MLETLFGNSGYAAFIAVTVYVLNSTMLWFDADHFFDGTKCSAKVRVFALLFKTRISQCKTKGMKIPFEGDRAIMTKLSGIKATLWEDGMYYSEVTGKKRELLEALDIPLPDAAVFTKAELACKHEGR